MNIFNCGCNIGHVFEEVYKSKAVCSLATGLGCTGVLQYMWSKECHDVSKNIFCGP